MHTIEYLYNTSDFLLTVINSTYRNNALQNDALYRFFSFPS